LTISAAPHILAPVRSLRLSFIRLVAIMGLVGESSLADVLATAGWTGGGGTHSIRSSVQIYLSNGGATNGGAATIFDSFSFTASQSGQTFSLDQ
jgi:hypothetical protein